MDVVMHGDAWKGTNIKSTNYRKRKATLISPISVGGKLMWT